MKNLQNVKYAMAIAPASASGGSHTPVSVDTAGFNECTIVALLGSLGATMAALEIHESDNDSSWSAVTGLVTGTSTDMLGGATTLPVGTTDDGKIVAFEIDLRGRKRYLKVVSTAGAGATLVGAVAILGRAESLPNTLAGRGCLTVMRV